MGHKANLRRARSRDAAQHHCTDGQIQLLDLHMLHMLSKLSSIDSGLWSKVQFVSPTPVKLPHVLCCLVTMADVNHVL